MIRIAAVEAVENGSGLPLLVERAASALMSARSAAEVLEARDLASLAYDAAKRAARVAQAKGAHDALVAAAHRAQADALEIEAGAKRRLADEYDAAQERGEVVGPHGGGDSTVPNRNAATAADLGLSRKEIHEARKIRDAEEKDPGIVRRTLDSALERGAEPSKAEVRRAVAPDVMARKLAAGDAAADAAMDQKEFRRFRKLWKDLRPGARALAPEYLRAKGGLG